MSVFSQTFVLVYDIGFKAIHLISTFISINMSGRTFELADWQNTRSPTKIFLQPHLCVCNKLLYIAKAVAIGSDDSNIKPLLFEPSPD